MKSFLKTGAALFLLVMLLPPATIRAEQTAELSIFFLDVGQGDATILHQPGGCTVVIDAGPLLNGHKLTHKLQELGVDSIDMLIVTHPHLDHFGGLFDVAPRLPIIHFFDNGANNQNGEYFDDYRRMRQELTYQTLSRGDVLACGDITLNVLYPDGQTAKEDDLNGTSLVLMITFQNFRLLHMGDLAGPAVQGFLEKDDDITAAVLKVAHHGAADAASEQLLARATPTDAVISTAEQNRIGSPSDEVLKRLADNNINTLRTDRDGTVTLTVTRDGNRFFGSK